MLEEVAACFEEIRPENVRILCQIAGMREEEREAFLEEFSEEPEETLVGFCVMGSIFGEGIDLKRNG